MSVAVGIVRPEKFVLASDKAATGESGYYRNESLTKVIRPHEDFAVATVGTCSQVNIAQYLLCGTEILEIASEIQKHGFERFFMGTFRQKLHDAIVAGPHEDQEHHEIGMLWACAREEAIYHVDAALGYTLCNTYTAIGSGSYHAIGALCAFEASDPKLRKETEHCARVAIWTAGEFCPDCRRESDVITVERKGNE